MSKTFMNPFTPGRSVPPERFVGRQTELDRILATLRNMGSVLLVGESRIGKTSILQYLNTHLRDLLSSHGDYFPIYISIDTVDGEQDFCKKVLEKLLPNISFQQDSQKRLAHRLERCLDEGQPVEMSDTARILEWTNQTNMRVVLLLDEFHHLLQKKDFQDVFHGTFRNLYSLGKISFVFATRPHHLEAVERDKAGEESSYFTNAALREELGRFTTVEEARQLLAQPSYLKFTTDEILIGLNVGELHPWRLQYTGFLLYEYKKELSRDFYDAQGDIRPDAEQRLKKRADGEFGRITRRYKRATPDNQSSFQGVNNIDIANNQQKFKKVLAIVFFVLIVVFLLVYGRIFFLLSHISDKLQ